MKHSYPMVIFGCSWAAGAGVLPDQTFGFLLSTMLGSSSYNNYAMHGSSNHRSLLQLLAYIEKNKFNVVDHVAIFSITTSGRSAFIDHDGKVIDLIARQNESNEKLKSWVNHFFSLPHFDHDLHKNIICLQQICKHYGINDFYIPAWEEKNLNLPGIDQTKIFPKTCINLFGYNSTQEYLDEYHSRKNINPYIRECGHPSVSGHYLIANTLHEWMKNKIV